jgi:transcriptional regulator with XRE-family HTH domain
MLNEALKQIRLFHKLNQKELAEKLKVSKSYISEIESSKKSVSMDMLKKYSDVFSIPPSSLLLFSENLEAYSRSERIRLKCAKKVVNLMAWVNASGESK